MTTCDLINGMLMTESSACPDADLTAKSAVLHSQRPALCCGSRQWMKRTFVLRNVSTKPSTVNLTWRQTDFRFIAAVPAVKVRLILEALRRD